MAGSDQNNSLRFLHNPGYRISKNGQDKLTSVGIESELWFMRFLNLRNADGSEFNPTTYLQLRNWLQHANSKNMTYMLSAQVAAMFLNVISGYVNFGTEVVYTPGCGFLGNNNFRYLGSLAWDANYYLHDITSSLANDPDRFYLECLKNGLDKANNNLNFVQPYPCNLNTETVSERSGDLDIAVISHETGARIWPNPTTNHFTLRVADFEKNKAIRIKVFDMNGRQVYATTGSATKDYNFGEKFTPGIYMAEVIQGNTRKTFKLVKQ